MIRHLFASILAVGLAHAADKPLNLILIMADDLGYETITCNGGESYTSPNLDRMAEGGMRFEHCYSQSICTPSRVQIMTGKYNDRNYTKFGELKRGEKTFAHLLKAALNPPDETSSSVPVATGSTCFVSKPGFWADHPCAWGSTTSG